MTVLKAFTVILGYLFELYVSTVVINHKVVNGACLSYVVICCHTFKAIFL